MTKPQLIQAIREHNRSANPQFLEGFEERCLESYLRRLKALCGRRGPETYWIREGDTHAVVSNAA